MWVLTSRWRKAGALCAACSDSDFAVLIAGQDLDYLQLPPLRF